MRIRVIKRYSECFKLGVVEELENGRFGSITEARLPEEPSIRHVVFIHALRRH